MAYAADPMQGTLIHLPQSEGWLALLRLGRGLLISALLHLAIILSFGPRAEPPAQERNQPPRQMTVTLIAKSSLPEPLKPAARTSSLPSMVSSPLPSAPRYFESKEVDVPARVINDVMLRYPVLAYQQRSAGAVTLKVFINESGEVDKAEVVASEPKEIFDAAAVDAANQLRYSPALKNGTPVKTTKTIAITFDPTTDPL